MANLRPLLLSNGLKLVSQAAELLQMAQSLLL